MNSSRGARRADRQGNWIFTDEEREAQALEQGEIRKVLCDYELAEVADRSEIVVLLARAVANYRSRVPSETTYPQPELSRRRDLLAAKTAAARLEKTLDALPSLWLMVASKQPWLGLASIDLRKNPPRPPVGVGDIALRETLQVLRSNIDFQLNDGARRKPGPLLSEDQALRHRLESDVACYLHDPCEDGGFEITATSGGLLERTLLAVYEIVGIEAPQEDSRSFRETLKRLVSRNRSAK